MSAAGSIVFDNLPLLFAIGVAIGMAKREKKSPHLRVLLRFYYAYRHKCVDFRKLCRRRYEYGRNGTGCCEFGAKSRSERCNVNGTWYIRLIWACSAVSLSDLARRHCTTDFIKYNFRKCCHFSAVQDFVPIISAVVFFACRNTYVFYLAVYSKKLFQCLEISYRIRAISVH